MISSDMSQYFSDQDRIKKLERRLKTLDEQCSTWQRRYHELKGTQTTRQVRSVKARELIQALIDGDKALSFTEISEKCFLSIKTIWNISCELRKKG